MYNAQHNETYNPETLLVSGKENLFYREFYLLQILFLIVLLHCFEWIFLLISLLKFCAGFLMVQVYECQE